MTSRIIKEAGVYSLLDNIESALWIPDSLCEFSTKESKDNFIVIEKRWEELERERVNLENRLNSVLNKFAVDKEVIQSTLKEAKERLAALKIYQGTGTTLLRWLGSATGDWGPGNLVCNYKAGGIHLPGTATIISPSEVSLDKLSNGVIESGSSVLNVFDSNLSTVFNYERPGGPTKVGIISTFEETVLNQIQIEYAEKSNSIEYVQVLKDGVWFDARIINLNNQNGLYLIEPERCSGVKVWVSSPSRIGIKDISMRSVQYFGSAERTTKNKKTKLTKGALEEVYGYVPSNYSVQIFGETNGTLSELRPLTENVNDFINLDSFEIKLKVSRSEGAGTQKALASKKIDLPGGSYALDKTTPHALFRNEYTTGQEYKLERYENGSDQNRAYRTPEFPVNLFSFFSQGKEVGGGLEIGSFSLSSDSAANQISFTLKSPPVGVSYYNSEFALGSDYHIMDSSFAMVSLSEERKTQSFYVRPGETILDTGLSFIESASCSLTYAKKLQGSYADLLDTEFTIDFDRGVIYLGSNDSGISVRVYYRESKTSLIDRFDESVNQPVVKDLVIGSCIEDVLGSHRQNSRYLPKQESGNLKNSTVVSLSHSQILKGSLVVNSSSTFKEVPFVNGSTEVEDTSYVKVVLSNPTIEDGISTWKIAYPSQRDEADNILIDDSFFSNKVAGRVNISAQGDWAEEDGYIRVFGNVKGQVTVFVPVLEVTSAKTYSVDYKNGIIYFSKEISDGSIEYSYFNGFCEGKIGVPVRFSYTEEEIKAKIDNGVLVYLKEKEIENPNYSTPFISSIVLRGA